MQKKLKIRVKWEEGIVFDCYRVQYSQYYLFPIFWDNLSTWYHPENHWYELSYTVEEAEKMAKTLKTIKDLEAFYKPSLEAERLYDEKQQKKKPYNVKYF